jgi:26S proteasome regulatory subunit N3
MHMQVRYLYYMGRVQAIQLDYSDAFNKLMQAIRKTPSHTAHGFRVAVYKLTTCVQLLLGETPERAWFSDPELKSPLAAYFELVKAVREGNIRCVVVSVVK